MHDLDAMLILMLKFMASYIMTTTIWPHCQIVERAHLCTLCRVHKPAASLSQFSFYRPNSGSSTMCKSNCVIEILFHERGGPPMQDQSSLKASESFQFRLETLSRGEMPYFHHVGCGDGEDFCSNVSRTQCKTKPRFWQDKTMLKPHTKHLFIPKKTIDAESWVLAQLVRSEAGCLAHGMRHTCSFEA